MARPPTKDQQQDFAREFFNNYLASGLNEMIRKWPPTYNYRHYWYELFQYLDLSITSIKHTLDLNVKSKK